LKTWASFVFAALVTNLSARAAAERYFVPLPAARARLKK
jgi:hypothetical protein